MRIPLVVWFLVLPASVHSQVPLRPVPIGATASRTSGELPVPHRIVPIEGVCPEEAPHASTPAVDTVYADSTYLEATVDRPPELIKAGKSRYPVDLQKAGVGGRVQFSFVIDTLGHPEPCSFHVHSAIDPRLEVAAFRMVLDNLFLPGEVRGQKVRVMVLQAVSFNP